MEVRRSLDRGYQWGHLPFSYPPGTAGRQVGRASCAGDVHTSQSMADRMGILAPGKCLFGGVFDRCHGFQLVEEILEAAAEDLLHVGCCRGCGISCAAESSAVDRVARVMVAPRQARPKAGERKENDPRGWLKSSRAV